MEEKQKEEVLGAELALARLIFRTRQLLYKTYSKYYYYNFGISPEQQLILQELHFADEPPNPATIARNTLREPNTIFTNLKRMEKNGLVELEKDAVWKNRVRVIVTEKGREIFKETVDDQNIHHVFFSELNEKEKEQLHILLEKVFQSNYNRFNSKFNI